MDSIVWKSLDFDGLTNKQLYQILQLRVEVFVVEQTCYYQDLDGKDCESSTRHLVGFNGDNIVAYARLLAPGVPYPEFASIGRVIVSGTARGLKLGDRLMEQAIQQCQLSWPDVPIKISAQQHLQGYYQKHGFRTVSSMYLEDDIPHVAMCTDC